MLGVVSKPIIHETAQQQVHEKLKEKNHCS